MDNNSNTKGFSNSSKGHNNNTMKGRKHIQEWQQPVPTRTTRVISKATAVPRATKTVARSTTQVPWAKQTIRRSAASNSIEFKHGSKTGDLAAAALAPGVL